MGSDIPATMKAIVATQEGYASSRPSFPVATFEPFAELAEVAVPQPGPGQVLVKMRYAAVNPSDNAYLLGVYGQPRLRGVPAGFEGIGDVVASGPGFLSRRLNGKRVSLAARMPGTWAQYAVGDATRCIPLRSGVRDQDGAGLVVNPITAVAMVDIVRKSGSKAFVMSAAASQLCKFIAKIASEEGYKPIALVRRDEQVEPLLVQGSAHVLNITAGDFADRLADVLGTEKPIVFLDAVTGPLGAQVFDAMGRNARWIVYGRLDTSGTPIPEPGQLIFQSKRIEGFWLTSWVARTSLLKRLGAVRTVQNRFAKGLWRTDITAELPLDEAIAGLPAALADPNGKALIRLS